MIKTVYLSLGANLGNRQQNLRAAIERLGPAGITVRRVSSIYETEPLDLVGQPMFLNLVVEAETALMPLQLLMRALRIERELGRKRTVPKGPRTIDIDIILYGSSVINAPELVVPHPRLAERRFVLEPLAELVPDLRHPVTRRTVREMLAAVTAQKVRRTAL
ncbi:MAG: 2-amino-4-hydroxy-6-hydroxymethyldihydropteridine diphosphokinase [Acidobacteriales bacterium]|nr:2-amino-4-hydroxy-6-hydroxymethyldihydropteridine diphosphokinase [Terriglobales bacterium]